MGDKRYYRKRLQAMLLVATLSVTQILPYATVAYAEPEGTVAEGSVGEASGGSTDVPGENEPDADAPSADKPDTDVPSESEPGTDVPSESKPGTDVPSESEPGTDVPSESKPGTDAPSESKPGTDAPSESEPGTDAPSESEPGTDAPSESKPGTDAPSESEPDTDAPSESEPGIDAPGEDNPADKPTEGAPEEKPSHPTLDNGTTESEPEEKPETEPETESEPISINSATDLYLIQEQPDGHFILEDNIRLSADVLSDLTFTGTLDGQGYVISGVETRLFKHLSGAKLQNLFVSGGMLAERSTDSEIADSGFYVRKKDATSDAAVILKSEHTVIRDSFAFMNVEGDRVAGFLLEGSGRIEGSYVSGYIKGKTVYGFGEDADITNSYISASLVGNKRSLFGGGSHADSYYDVRMNDIVEEEAGALYTEDLTSGSLGSTEPGISAFFEEEGRYPQIKNIDLMSEEARAMSELSTISLLTESNLSALEGPIEMEEDGALEWKSKRATLENGTAVLEGDSGELFVTRKDEGQEKIQIRRFALKAVDRSITQLTAGNSTDKDTTQISYPVTMGTYYCVAEDGITVTVPADHDAAIDEGWKLAYWSGVFRETELSWDTTYTLWSTDLQTLTKVGDITTKKQRSEGSLSLSGSYDVGETMTVDLASVNTEGGTLHWETALTLDAASWAEMASKTIAAGTTEADYLVTDQEYYKYLRARFVPSSASVTGELTAVTDTVAKHGIDTVVIKKGAQVISGGTACSLDDALQAAITPTNRENDVTYIWYHKAIDDTETEVGQGKNYRLKGSDIGKTIYVKAVAKEEGLLKGEKSSDATGIVARKTAETPTQAPTMVKIEDTTVTVKMDTAEGLYRFAIGTSADVTDSQTQIHQTLARAQTTLTFTELTADTEYHVLVQRAGENGYADSDWGSQSLTVTTQQQFVKGNIVITGTAIYEETLTASIENALSVQTGDFSWHRLDVNGNRIAGTEVAGDTYPLGKDDIGHKIEAVYTGTGSYSGTVTNISDVVTKKQKAAPADVAQAAAGNPADTSITVTLPQTTIAADEKFHIGYSTIANGVPQVVEDPSAPGTALEFAPGAQHTITGLKRDTAYYFFIRYAETDSHQKSPWTTTEVTQRTEKKTLTATLDFTYESTELMQGQTLTANVSTADSDFNYRGVWKWYRIAPDQTETEINDFAFTTDKQGTMYLIPSTETVGVTYKVTFTPNVGYTGSFTATTSKKVEAFKLAAYTAPRASDLEVKPSGDTSLTVKMTQGAGQYQFRYKKVIRSFSPFKSLRADADYTVVQKTVYSGIDVELTGLARNTNYVVSAIRIGDSTGSKSPWSTDVSKATDKTAIAGHVELSGDVRNKETLTAVYQPATYAPVGDDSSGTWSWYRTDGIQAPVEIPRADTATYQVQPEDVEKILTARYSMPTASDFSGFAEASTKATEKAFCVAPEAEINEGVSADKLILKVKVTNWDTDQKVYYRVQPEYEAAPGFPTTQGLSDWTEVTSGNVFDVENDYQSTDLSANGRYVLYLIRMENASIQSSGIVSYSHTMGTKAQKGSITLAPIDSADAGFLLVGKTVKATLSGSNNTKGEWRWYVSKQDYKTAPNTDLTNTNNWTEITSGFSQNAGNTVSSLNMTEDLWKHYIVAEFSAREEQGYSGKVTSPVVQNQTFVRRILEEKLRLTSSTTDGNGNPKAYPGTIITATLENSHETTLASGRPANNNIGIYIGNTLYLQPIPGTGLTFQYTVPTSNTFSDGVNIDARIAKLSGKEYVESVNGTLQELTASQELRSSTSTQTSCIYATGVKISNPTELAAFMAGTENYSNRAGHYILTDNINMANSPKVALPNTPFTGTFDGDYHTIVGMKNPLILEIGTASNQATVKNCIIYNANVDVAKVLLVDGKVNQDLSSGAIIAQTGQNALLENLFLVDSALKSDWDTGYFIGRARNNGQPFIVRNCGSAGGGVVSTGNGTSVGGFAGCARAIDIDKFFSINTKLRGTNSGGLIGYITSHALNPIVKNSYIASPPPTNAVEKGTLAASGLTETLVISNTFYDSTLLAGVAGITLQGTGKTTQQMIGTGLSSLGTGWTYKTGFYPQLDWLSDHPISNLYAATRASFVSLDSKTDATNMFLGKLSGSIQVPAEFQNKDYTVSSSNSGVLKVVGNTIIPVGAVNTKATITIKYTEPDPTIGGSVTNSFEFTVASSVQALSKVEIQGDPQYGSTLTADTGSVTATGFQWYRRKAGSTSATVINGATASTYKLQAADIGSELAVEVSAAGYATMRSAYTTAVQSAAPAAAPTVQSTTDQSITLQLTGLPELNYQVGYSLPGEQQILLPDPYKGDAVVQVPNLKRNTTYQFFYRVAAGNGYSESPWSPAASRITDKTPITGAVVLGSEINNGATLTMSAEKTNGQTGVWKLERIGSDGTTTVINASHAATNACTYQFQTADVGSKIKVTFTGSGDFKDSITAETAFVKKSTGIAPAMPVFVKQTDGSITVKVGAAGSQYHIAYSTERNGAQITLFDQAGAAEITLPGLKRNTTYYIVAQTAGDGGAEPSGWSQALTTSTEKSTVDGELTISGTLKTAEEIQFTMPNSKDQTGTWKLERISMKNGANTGNVTISPSLYQVSRDTRELTYQIRPVDADDNGTTNQLKATFIGTGDYQGSKDKTTVGSVEKEKPDTQGIPIDAIVISDIKDDSLKVKTTGGTEQYQFGYKESSAPDTEPVTLVEAMAYSNQEVTLNGLRRNTSYDIYLRKAPKVGYEASDFVKTAASETTDKTMLTGRITYTVTKDGASVAITAGSAFIGNTYTVSYATGTYTQTGDDTTEGWNWYSDGVPITGSTGNSSYTVTPMVGTPEITARYEAKPGSDFKGSVEVSIGNISKTAHPVPGLPDVTAVPENGSVGSILFIQPSTASADQDGKVYYYVKEAADETIPAVIPAADAAQNVPGADVWFPANQVTVSGLKPNTDYMVYTARLEDGNYLASPVVSPAAVRTVLEDLARITASNASIIAADPTAPFKLLQKKELCVSYTGIAATPTPTTGVWQYYVSKTPTDPTSWQNIGADVKAAAEEQETTAYAYTKVTIPLKYRGYFVKAEYTGRGDFEGTLSFTSSSALEGKTMTGQIEVVSSTDVAVLTPIQVEYRVLSGNQIPPVDEPNGIFTWYREVKDQSGNSTSPKTFEAIRDESGEIYTTVGVKSSYTPIASDVGKEIYAIYAASLSGEYVGEVKSGGFGTVQKKDQTKPDAPTQYQVAGTDIQVLLPANYKTDGDTVPEVLLGYQKPTDSTTTWQTTPGTAWVKGLEKNTEYQVYAKFLATSEYKESEVSPPATITTGSRTFDVAALTLESEGGGAPESQKYIKAVYTGPGYEEGYFKVVRSDGTVVVATHVGIADPAAQTNTMQYTVSPDDIGANLQLQYHAKTSAVYYSGFVEKVTELVTKPAPNAVPTAPSLTQVRLDETILKAELSSAYEYVLTETADAVTAKSSWRKLTALAPNTTEEYTFTGLDKEKTYYLHARLAETAEYQASFETVGAGTKPWSRTSYAIHYEGMDAAVNGTGNPVEYTELSSLITLADPSRVGHTFTGWTYDTVTTPVKNPTIPSGSQGEKTFTANWQVNRYDITFDSAGGSTVALQSSDYDTLLMEPAAPTKKGYTLAGWYQTNPEILWDFAADKMPANNIELKASWSLNSYVVTFESNGGSAVAPQVIPYDTPVATPSEAVREGYTFTGWYADEALQNTWNFATDKISDADMSLYADWSINSYTASFDGNGGHKKGDPAVTTQTITKDYQDSWGTLPEFERDYYIFAGFYTDQTTGEPVTETTKVPSKSVTYYARWIPVEYQIHYELNQGENHPSNPTTYTVESQRITLQAPSRPYYVFTGWTTDGIPEPQKELMLMPGSHGDKAFTANWKAADSQAVFDSQGGSQTETFYGVTEDLVPRPSEPVKAGQIFDGWYRDTAFTTPWNFDTDRLRGDMTLYAKWQAKHYTVSYDSTGGSAVPDRTDVQYDTSDLMPKSEPSYSGYRLKGWLTSAGAEVTKELRYRDLVSDDSVMGITLTAVWEKKSSGGGGGTSGGGTIGGGDGTGPGAPVIPEQPGTTPGLPGQPEQPGTTPDLPGQPEQPGTTPGLPGQSETTPDNPGQASDLAPASVVKEIPMGAGIVKVEMQGDVTVKDEKKFIEAVLTKEQKESLNSGGKLEIRLEVKPVSKDGINSREIIEKAANENKLVLSNYYEVGVQVQDGSSWVSVQELNEGVELIFRVEKDQQDLNAAFYVIREHNGGVDVLEDMDDKKETVTVLSDRFSSYALAYRLNDDAQKTDPTDEFNWRLALSVTVIAGTAMFYVLWKRKEKQEKKNKRSALKK